MELWGIIAGNIYKDILHICICIYIYRTYLYIYLYIYIYCIQIREHISSL